MADTSRTAISASEAERLVPSVVLARVCASKSGRHPRPGEPLGHPAAERVAPKPPGARVAMRQNLLGAAVFHSPRRAPRREGLSATARKSPVKSFTAGMTKCGRQLYGY